MRKNSTSSITRRRNTSDPLAAALLPPPNETEEERYARLEAETEAKKKSDSIDEMIQKDRKKSRNEVKVLLLGQSESGKSTTLKRECYSVTSIALAFLVVLVVNVNFVLSLESTPSLLSLSMLSAFQNMLLSPFLVDQVLNAHLCTEFQLLHTPSAFHKERIAWRAVIYLNLVRSIRRYVVGGRGRQLVQHD